MNGVLVRHRRSELSTVGVIYLGDLELFTLERRAEQLGEGVYTLTLVGDGQRIAVGDTGAEIAPAIEVHGTNGQIGVGIGAGRHALTCGDQAFGLLIKAMKANEGEQITVEIIDQSEDGDDYHEDRF